MELKLNRDNLPILNQFSEPDFVDCVLKIEGLASDGGYYTFHMSASFEGERVGADVRVLKGIKAGFDSEMNLTKDGVHNKGVYFMRSCQESDRLISAIARLYGMDGTGLSFAKSESFTAIALHQGDIDLEREGVRIKIFGRDSDPDLERNYFESFFNVDLPNGLVFWNEKDPDYREPLLRALGGRP
jgi:hypothetical protein